MAKRIGPGSTPRTPKTERKPAKPSKPTTEAPKPKKGWGPKPGKPLE
ncbi:MAG: hypothetical protein AMXMBFR34_09890 [Myxococcaceae bacterium]